MTPEAVFAELESLLKSAAFAVEQPVSPGTRFADIAGWDSFKHLRFMLEVEEVFEFELAPEQGEAIETLEDLVQAATGS